MKIKNYIESGILEAYVMGSASETETQELLLLKEQHPEVANALFDLELDLERLAQQMSINPPPGTLTKIEDAIGDLVKTKIDNTKMKTAPAITATRNFIIRFSAG